MLKSFSKNIGPDILKESKYNKTGIYLELIGNPLQNSGIGMSCPPHWMYACDRKWVTWCMCKMEPEPVGENYKKNL